MQLHSLYKNPNSQTLKLREAEGRMWSEAWTVL